MRTATALLAHPILFVFDFSNREFSVPEYDPLAPVSRSATGLSIKAISDVDGEVTVHLTDRIPPGGVGTAHEVFVGSIPTPSRTVAVVTSENEKLLEVDVSSVEAKVRILVDEPVLPSNIWVEAR